MDNLRHSSNLVLLSQLFDCPFRQRNCGVVPNRNSLIGSIRVETSRNTRFLLLRESRERDQILSPSGGGNGVSVCLSEVAASRM